MLRLITPFLILFALSPVQASIQCDTGVPVGGHIGVPTEISSLVQGFFDGHPSLHGMVAERPEQKLNRVDIAWLPGDSKSRHRFQEVIVIDWLNQSTTQVDLYDGAVLGIVERGMRQAELLGSTNWSSGHLDIIFCMPVNNYQGLIFAYYGAGGAIENTFVVPFAWRHVDNGLWFSTVVNEAISDLFVPIFNRVIVNNVTDDVERSTGVRPPRYLAESLIQQNLKPFTDLVSRDQAVFFNGHNAIVVGNKIVITGDNASISAVHSVDDVYSNDQSILDSNFLLTRLEDHIGPISIKTHGDRRPAIIIDGRADFEATASECVNGVRQVSAQMKYASELSGSIELIALSESYFDQGGYIVEAGGDYGETVVSDHHSISTEVSCDVHLGIQSSRNVFDSDWVGLAQSPVLVDRDIAELAVKDASPYIIYLQYTTNREWDFGPYPVRVSDAELITKTWGIDNIASLRGISSYGCSAAGDETVDSIDEIVSNAIARLTPQELSEMGLVQPYIDDGDGDGSVCNRGEPGTDFLDYIKQVDLIVIPNLTPHQE